MTKLPTRGGAPSPKGGRIGSLPAAWCVTADANEPTTGLSRPTGVLLYVKLLASDQCVAAEIHAEIFLLIRLGHNAGFVRNQRRYWWDSDRTSA